MVYAIAFVSLAIILISWMANVRLPFGIPGGLAAINYGLALGADRVLSFSGPTSVTAGFLDRHDDRRGRIVTARILQKAPAHLLDLRPRVADDAGRTRIDLVFGEDMRQDRAHAEHLAGLPGVRLFGLAGCDRHASLGELIRRDLLSAAISGRDLPEAGRVTW